MGAFGWWQLFGTYRQRLALALSALSVLAFAVAEVQPWVRLASNGPTESYLTVPLNRMGGVPAGLFQLFIPVLLALVGRVVLAPRGTSPGAAGSAIGMACGELVLAIAVLAAGAASDPARSSYGAGAVAAFVGLTLVAAAVMVAGIRRAPVTNQPPPLALAFPHGTDITVLPGHER